MLLLFTKKGLMEWSELTCFLLKKSWGDSSFLLGSLLRLFARAALQFWRPDKIRFTVRTQFCEFLGCKCSVYCIALCATCNTSKGLRESITVRIFRLRKKWGFCRIDLDRASIRVWLCDASFSQARALISLLFSSRSKIYGNKAACI